MLKRFCVLLLMILSSCGSFDVVVKYNPISKLTEPTTNDVLFYSDKYYSIIFDIQEYGMDFIISNKSSDKLKLNWDEIIFINTDGSANRIIHNKIKLIDKEYSQTPTIVPKHSFYFDGIVPSDNIYWDEEYVIAPTSNLKSFKIYHIGKWACSPLLDRYSTNLNSLINKNVRLYLPIETSGKKLEYYFQFQYIAIKTNTYTNWTSRSVFNPQSYEE